MRAVVCLRGGYGAQRIVDELDFAADPEPLVGFPDIWCEARLSTVLAPPVPACDDPATVALGVPAVLDADAGTLVTEALGR